MFNATPDIVRLSSELETIVRDRNPPRRRAVGWVYVPGVRGAGTARTLSALMLYIELDESSLSVGLMKSKDSAKEREKAELEVEVTTSSEMRPPTFRPYADEWYIVIDQSKRLASLLKSRTTYDPLPERFVLLAVLFTNPRGAFDCPV